MNATVQGALLRALLMSAAVFIVLFQPHVVSAAQINVSIMDNFFSPKNITINAGDTVVWRNNGATSHTVTADDGSFGSGTLAPGATYTRTFTTQGLYTYTCQIHSGMEGTVTVAAAAAAATVTSAGASVTAPPAASNTSSGSATVDTLRAQIQSLLSQIAQLQQQFGGSSSNATVGAAASTGTGANCPRIGTTLRPGSRGDDVRSLQQFLAQDPLVYPEGLVTGYYGPLTQKAVERWQTKYNIVSSGTPATTGFGQVGPRTAAAIAILCSTGSYNGIPAPSSVGGFISVSPTSGAAPLPVSVTATVNTTKSCIGATYTLDFGDGSATQQIPVSAGNCNQVEQTFAHTYRYSGNYEIKLSADSHETSAKVSVSGVSFTPGLPRESFSVSPLSGMAPLTVTFSGIVTSNDAGFCEKGCASILDFGDGSSAPVTLPASVGGWLNYSVTHTYTKSGGFKATLYQGGAGAEQPTVGSATIVVSPGASTGSNTKPAAIAPQGTLTTFVTSGAVPFDATFYVSCLNGVAYDVVFGDGQDLGAAGVSESACKGGLQAVTHTYMKSGTFTVSLVVFTQQPDGTMKSQIIDQTTITVSGAAMETSALNGSPTAGLAPLSVNFSVRGAGPVRGDYTLDFGDGSLPQVFVCQTGLTACASSMQANHVYNLPGTYSAKLTSPSGAQIGAVAITVSGGTESTQNTDSSNTSDNTSNTSTDTTSTEYSYSTPLLVASGSDTLSFTLQFDLPSACSGYSLSWGDSTPLIAQNHSASCAQNPVMNSFPHTFSAGGSYTVVLKRGATLSRVDDISLTIAN